MKHSLKIPSGYTLIEVMMGILIVSIVMISAFYALSAANIGKIRLMNKGDMDVAAYYFQENLIDTIKQAGIIDYEEYFNRMVINSGTVDLYESGHYLIDSSFGNSSDPLYLCRSGNGDKMGTDGCITSHNIASAGAPNVNTDYSGKQQMYNQYSYMAMDYNSDANGDGGDADGDGNIVGDNDDAYIGDLPAVFSSTGAVTELYLISGDKKRRTFLRWHVVRDPKAPATAPCTGLNGDPSLITGSGCLGTIEMLKLEGVDWGFDHDLATQDASQFDGIVDTWIYDRKFYGLSSGIVASGSSDKYWIPLFANEINVKKVSFFLLPNKDPKLAWKDTSPSVNVAPFLKIYMIITPSIAHQSGMKGKIPEYSVSTTVNLSSVFSN